MAAGGFSYLSSPGSSSSSTATAAEVEALIAEAADLAALEQIARLNSAHIAADDALLPADVESRFRRLKTFPAPSQTPTNLVRHRSSNQGLAPPAAEHEELDLTKSGSKPAAADTASPVRPGGEDERSRGSGTPPPFSPATPSSASPRGGSPSPPRGRACCFGFSPRKGDRSKKGGGGGGGGGDAGPMKGESRRSLLPDLGALSPREQRQIMRRAAKEEEKVLREAQRMAKWMKRASARMEVSAATVDELLSELEDEG